MTDEAWQARAEAAESELRAIDGVMARRPALDQPTRWQNIEKAINAAKRGDETERSLNAAVTQSAREIRRLEKALEAERQRRAQVEQALRTVETALDHYFSYSPSRRDEKALGAVTTARNAALKAQEDSQ